MAFTPIAIADLGASLDALPTAGAIAGKFASMSPALLVCCAIVTSAPADLRLYRYDAELLRWVPSAVATATCAVGVHELRFNTAGISGLYALVNTSATGTVSYVFRSGTN